MSIRVQINGERDDGTANNKYDANVAGGRFRRVPNYNRKSRTKPPVVCLKVHGTSGRTLVRQKLTGDERTRSPCSAVTKIAVISSDTEARYSRRILFNNGRRAVTDRFPNIRYQRVD